MSDGLYTHEYDYRADSRWISEIRTLHSGSAWFRERRHHDVRGRLIGIRSDRMDRTSVLQEISGRGYGLDELGRQVRATARDGSSWEYSYNERSEVSTAGRSDPGGSKRAT